MVAALLELLERDDVRAYMRLAPARLGIELMSARNQLLRCERLASPEDAGELEPWPGAE